METLLVTCKEADLEENSENTSVYGHHFSTQCNTKSQKKN